MQSVGRQVDLWARYYDSLAVSSFHPSLTPPPLKPLLRVARSTATYPLCCVVQADAGGVYTTGFVTSPGQESGAEVTPKGRAVLLREELGAKLYFRGSEEGSES